MRKALGMIVMGMFFASLAYAGGHNDYTAGYEEERILQLASSGIRTLDIEAGAGSLKVYGGSDDGQIRVTAIVQVSEEDEDDAREIIEENLTLALDQRGLSSPI